MDCATCGGKVDAGKDGPTVRVLETRYVPTHWSEGHNSGGEDVPTYAGVFCSRSCAAVALSEGETR